MIILRILLFAIGVWIVYKTLRSAVVTFVLPRATSDILTRRVFLTVRRVFNFASRNASTHGEVDAIWALFAPVSLLLLPAVWIILVFLGYGLIFWAVGAATWSDALTISGSSLLTLGFAPPATRVQTILCFSEAGIGLGLVALLISFLPTIYATWSRREAAVARLESRAGSPPTAVEMVVRFFRLGRVEKLNDLWEEWEVWFGDIEETHTSFGVLALFRSPQPDRSWVTAAGVVLDAASLVRSTLDIPRNIQADLTIRVGYIALRRLATFYRLPFNPDPHWPEEPIKVTREEYDAVYDQLAEAGVPVVSDREAAWRDFAGWRVTYETPLLALAGLTLAPPAPWSGDRAIPYPY